mgnify:CR=1 FL=1
MQVLEVVEKLFAQYGYLVLLFGLPLDFIASPIPPGNSTLTYTGYLSHRGILVPFRALTLAFAGACIGFTVTYLFGYKVGNPLIERYGKWLMLKPEYVHKTRRYYDKYGDKLLLVGFFIPGLRQFLGYFLGIIGVPIHKVLLYAYPGIALWVLAFFGVGYFFADEWQQVFHLVERYLLVFSLAAAAVLLVFLVYKGRRRKTER